MLVVASRLILPMAIVVALYIFLRGHNMPGGGFIAGLVVAIGVVVQYMASGFAWAEARHRFAYHGIIGMGVLIAGLTGIGAYRASVPHHVLHLHHHPATRGVRGRERAGLRSGRVPDRRWCRDART